jgi:hypothetical protein
MAIKSLLTGQEMSPDNPLAIAASGEGFTNPLGVEALPVLEKQEQYVAEHMQEFTERVDSGRLGTSDLELAARSFVDGLWLNKAEEAGSYISAVAVKIIYPDLFEGRSVSDIREEMLVKLEAESAEFAERKPLTAATTNIAGSILSPVSVAGGQLISQAARMRQGAQAAQVSDEVAATLGGAFAPRADEAAQLAQQLGRQQATGTTFGIPVSGKVAEIVSKTPTPVATAGVVGAEGAVIGYEGDTTEEKLANAAFTAGISAAVPFAFAGAKKTYDFATENKMATQVGKGKDFINLMFTEHGIAPIYRSVVSKAYGARTLTEQQARKMAGRALTPAMARETGKKFSEQAAQETERAKRVITTSTREAGEQAQLKLDEKIAEVKLLASKATGKAQQKYNDEVALLEEAKVNADVAKTLAVREADASVSAANASFRGQALSEAAPPGAPKETIAELGMLDPQDANAVLDDLWRQYGFKVANGKEFTLDANEATTFIDNIIKNHPELSLVENGNLLRNIKIYVAEEITTKAPSGVMKGEDLLQLRSNIGRAINGLSNESVSTRRLSAEIQDYFHEILEQGLTKSEVAELAADRTAWSIRSTVDDATAKASGGNARSGAFTATEYLDAVRSYSPRFAARGKGRLQTEAQQLAKTNAQNKDNIIGLADDQIKQVTRQAIKDRAILRGQLQRTRVLLKKQEAEEIANLKKLTQYERASDVAKGAMRERIADVKQKYALQLQDIDTRIAQATNETKTLSGMMPSNFNASVFESLFNTALVGQAALFASPGLSGSLKASLVTGGVGSALLSKELTQRIIARQSGGQEALRRGTTAIGEALDSVGVTPAETVGAQAGGVAALTTPKELMFSEERKETIRNLPPSGKRALYRNLESKGRLERLQAEDPSLFKELKKAAGK